MSVTAAKSSPGSEAATQEKTLRKLFLLIFLRGQSARSLNKEKPPTSITKKLGITLPLYALIGAFSAFFVGKPVFVLSVYLHGMTFFLLGMFIIASSGEALFNKEEADILLHRPVTAKTLLWSKVTVLCQVSLYYAVAFNLVGFIAGMFASDSGWIYLPVHALSTALEAIFCTSAVVLAYQLCLRWFGRERLDSMMTTGQVIAMIGITLGGQLLPRLAVRTDLTFVLSAKTWWIALLPPAWFAGFDDAIAGSRGRYSWILAIVGVAVTAVVLWLALERLAKSYEAGMQVLNEAAPPKTKQRESLRWLKSMTEKPPLSWWLRDSVERASFILVAAYLFRDRDIKLRIYPGLSPYVVLPIVLLFTSSDAHGMESFNSGMTGFMSAYLCLIPISALTLLKASQQWRAAEMFRVAPMRGPAALCTGARVAVLCILTLPLVAAFGILTAFSSGAHGLMLLLPSIIAMPVFSLVPMIGGAAAPLSMPVDQTSAGSGCILMAITMAIAGALSGIALLALNFGLFWHFIAVELAVAVAVSWMMKTALNRVAWKSAE